MSVVALRVGEDLLLQSRPPGLGRRVWLVGLVVLRLLPQMIILEALLAARVVKPLIPQLIVLCYEDRIVAALDLERCAREKERV